ncbi:MAG: flavodoxin family protein [Firmicutes bacterium]|nr:flavodoxin family protein [Bacillota bacterium]
MARILGISGSPRRAGTEHAVRVALEAAQEAARDATVETRFFGVAGKKVNGCIHCDRCLKEKQGRCPAFDDAFGEFAEAWLWADAYIIGSPVYVMGVTPQLYSLFSRTRALNPVISTEQYLRKVGGAVAVGGTRHGGQETTIQAIHNFYLARGVMPVGGRPLYGGATVWSRDQGEVGVRDDAEGMEMLRLLGRRVAAQALMLEWCGR